MKKLAVFYSVFLPVLSAVCLVGCGGHRVTPGESDSNGASTAGSGADYDPLELPRDREIIPLKHPVSGEVVGRQSFVAHDETESEQDTLSLTAGNPFEAVDSVNSQAFRVQLFTSKLFGEAREAASVAEEIFDRPVFVDYEVPYFKVRVGNLDTREKAETLRQKARAVGYSNAWVTTVTLNKREAPGLYDDLPDLRIVPDSILLDGQPYDDEEN